MSSSSSSSGNFPQNWLELPREVTAAIMSRLFPVDILTNVQFVCKSWFEISKDPLIWRRINMYNIGDLGLHLDLVGMCRHAVDRSSGMLEEINIERFVDDNLLIYIAERSKGLKRLGLAFCDRLSEYTLMDAISRFPLLEELDLTLCIFSSDFIAVTGWWCPHLISLKIISFPNIFTGDPDELFWFDDVPYSIGSNLLRLRYLQLFGNSMTNRGLTAILDGCRHLETLDLRFCINLVLDEALLNRCTDRVRHLRLPDDLVDFSDFAISPISGFKFSDGGYSSDSGYDADDNDD